jgi:hypothetical protein
VIGICLILSTVMLCIELYWFIQKIYHKNKKVVPSDEMNETM